MKKTKTQVVSVSEKQIATRTEKQFKLPVSISKKELKAKAPSLFTKKPHPKMSEWYQFVDTEKVIEYLQKSGFTSFDADQIKFRDKGNPQEGYQFHQVSMYHPNFVFLNKESGDVDMIFELLVTNSYNGYSKCNLSCSFYRLATNTGMLALSNDFMETVKSTSIEEMDALFNNILNHFIDMISIINKMKNKKLNEDEKKDLALGMAKIRHDVKDEGELLYDYTLLLEPLREEDKKDDMWTTYCLIQEKLINGYAFPKKDKEKVGRKIRSINHIELSMDLNKEMFNFVKSKL